MRTSASHGATLPALPLDQIGPQLAQAGLGGIVWEAGGVICLDLPAMQAAAREAGVFLWARQPGEPA